MEINALLDPYDKLNAEVSESLVWHSGSGNDILVKAMLGADMELPSADADQPNFCFEELSVSPSSITFKKSSIFLGFMHMVVWPLCPVRMPEIVFSSVLVSVRSSCVLLLE